jgi:cytochrome c
VRAALVAALLTAGAPALAQDRGAAAFEPCRACHALDPAAPPGAGPNLHGVVGRRFAGDPRFGYSLVLEAAGRSGDRWTREALDLYLADPEEALPGTWMTARVADAAERRALIDFLADPAAR